MKKSIMLVLLTLSLIGCKKNPPTFTLYVKNDGVKRKEILVNEVAANTYAASNGEITKIGDFEAREDTHLQAMYYREDSGYVLVQDTLIDTREMKVYTWNLRYGRYTKILVDGSWNTDTCLDKQAVVSFIPDDSMYIHVAKTGGNNLDVTLERWPVTEQQWNGVTVVDKNMAAWTPNATTYTLLVTSSSQGNWKVTSITIY